MNILDYIDNHLSLPINFEEITTVQARQCGTFNELIEIYKQDLTVTDSFRDCLAVSLAAGTAIRFDGDPFWMYLVGAPSSGKSTICELICADEYHTRPLSKLTGLVSGMGFHLAPTLQGKLVVIKDGTLLLESNPQELANVYGELRDIYDGQFEAQWRNGKSVSLNNISFGMLIGITERIYSLNLSALGERFLHCRLHSDRATELVRNESAINKILTGTGRLASEGEGDDQRSFPLQRSYTAGFLQGIHTRISNYDILRPSFTKEDSILLQALGDVIALSRASAAKDKKERILYDSSPEASTRVVKTLTRLGLSLCYVLGTDSLTREVMRLTTKVGLDTAHGRQYNVLRAIATTEDGINRQAIAHQTGIPLATCSTMFQDLTSLGIINEGYEKRKGSGGRPGKVLSIAHPWIKEAFRRTEHARRRESKRVVVTTKKTPVSSKGSPWSKFKKKKGT